MNGNSQVHPEKVSPADRVDDGFDGPLKNRGCTDVFFLLLFIAALGGMGYVSYLGITKGNPNMLVYGVDSWGNVCNQKNEIIPNVTSSGKDMTGIANLYHYNFLHSANPTGNTVKLCVKSCPTTDIATVTALQEFATVNDSRLCHYDVSVSSYHVGSLAADATCPPLPVLSTASILHRCIPAAAINAAQSVASGMSTVLNALDEDFLQKLTTDMETAWREMAYLSSGSVGVALIILVLLRFFAGVIIWLVIIVCALGSLAGTGFCWYTWYTYNKALNETPVSDQTDEDKELVTRWLIIACVVSGITLIILLILLVMRKRIALVVQLFKEAGKAIAKMPVILLQPIWTFLVLAASLAGLGYLFMYLETAGDPEIHSSGQVFYKVDELLFYLKWYHIFGTLWIIQFIIACQQMVIAGAIATWYFHRDKSQIGYPVLASTGRLIRYHLGTVAFGSLIIAIIQLMRMILAYVEKKLRGRTSKIVDFLLKCLMCCLWCFEKILKYINRNAYIETAIYGYNFCKAAKKAFTLIVTNALRVAAINTVGDFLLFLGKLGTAGVVVAVGLELLKTKPTLHYIWAPLLVVGLFAFFVAHVFLSVYEMAIDTVFLCFCEDCERNDGVQKPYYMSKDLMKYVENSNEAIANANRQDANPKTPTPM
ncbi:choline transporter-like protein 1 isoform X2 [Lingula anatina]|uniref:Choline transporter-like protein n=1 Tax=Lingula anatina TaxID=7574 RepID=A0A1S3IIK7_LINAN|nr:choline transporter-like protein 1 isoform X2 [Lingula anatina]|eukprot:XP_013398047.1 choline transporter-like protein 1 isoform X2 [Lingula anatina]